MVIKRDGVKVEFDSTKIENAIKKAFKEVDGEITQYATVKAFNIAKYIEDFYNKSKDDVSIEQIQDLCEKGLMSTKRKDVGKAYILYRDKRTKERQRKSNLIKIVKEKVLGLNIENQNANVDEKSFGGRRGEADRAIFKQYALDYCMSEMAKNNHLNNEIYIHDLDSYVLGCHNCLSIPLDKLLKNGFNTRQMDIRPANSVSTAFQLVAVIFQLQSLVQFG